MRKRDQLKFKNWFFILFFILHNFLIKSTFSLPPSFQWLKAWKDITYIGLSYKFDDTQQPWYSGVSFRIVGTFEAKNKQETLVTIRNGDLYHCILKIDFETQTIYAESTSSTDEKWSTSYAYFPFPYTPQSISIDLVVEKLRWPGGFYFYLSGQGPYYPCNSIVYTKVDELIWGNGIDNFQNYNIKRNIPLSDPFRRTYLWDNFNNRYYFDDKNLYYVNSTGVDETSGVPNGDRVPTQYNYWPNDLEIHLFAAGMYPTYNANYSWGGSIGVFLKDDQSQFYYRTNLYHSIKSSNSYCTSSSVALSGSNYLIGHDYPLDIDDGALPFNAILINQNFGVDIFIRETLWALGTIFHCGRHSYTAESVGLVYPNDGDVYSTTRFAISPIDCQYSPWTSWLPCSSTCKGGTTYRWRYPMNEVMAGGLECTVTSQISACNSDVECSPCTFTEWDNWSSCSASCNGGITSRTRQLVHSAPGCDALLKQTSTCNSTPCPIDCALSYWSPWTDCTKFLCEGTKSRYRVVVRQAQNSGAVCPSSDQLKQVAQCINDCEGICQTSIESICQNNGECVNIGSTDYYCKCASGFYGRNCTITSDNTFNIAVGTSSALALGLIVVLLVLLMNRS